MGQVNVQMTLEQMIAKARETGKACYDANGHEVCDPKPMEVPIGFHRPPDVKDLLRQLVQTEMSRQAQENGFETFEESDDMEIGEDFDPTSPWELTADQERAPRTPPRQPAEGDFEEEKPVDQKKKVAKPAKKKEKVELESQPDDPVEIVDEA